MRRSPVLLWRKFSSAALRRKNHGGAAGSREPLQRMTGPTRDVVVVPQQVGTWSWQSSVPVRNGLCAAVGDHFLSPSLVQQSRFASSLVKGVDIDVHEGDDCLLHLLRCEAEDCTKRSLNITLRKPPRPFILVKDEPGEMEMTLSRIYGLEDITLSCVLQVVSKEYQRKPEVGEDPESRTKMLQLTIAVKKGGDNHTLKLRCECYRDGFAIHQVDLEHEDEAHAVYRPYFSHGKDELVNNFQIFLYERGLNADFATYIERHLERKRLLKSVAALQKMTKFVEANSSPKPGAEI